jgi:hypothetical protein
MKAMITIDLKSRVLSESFDFSSAPLFRSGTNDLLYLMEGHLGCLQITTLVWILSPDNRTFSRGLGVLFLSIVPPPR